MNMQNLYPLVDELVALEEDTASQKLHLEARAEHMSLQDLLSMMVLVGSTHMSAITRQYLLRILQKFTHERTANIEAE